MKVFCFVKNSEEAKKFFYDIKSFLEEQNIELSSSLDSTISKDFDFAIVIGGDGTFLWASRESFLFDIPLVGINLGRFGFLTELRKDEAREELLKIINGKFLLENRLVLEAFLIKEGREIKIGHFLNDIVLSRQNISRLIDLEIKTKDELVAKIYGDGIIISTPTGSTAYALSAGGPILVPTLEVILFVPICPHTLSIRPIIFPKEKELILSLFDKTEKAFLTLDGQVNFEITKTEKILIRASNKYLRIIKPSKRTFFEILREKLNWT